ncbi:MAG: DUF1573 domain-containing protein [Draconibacterium sp.]|nr:DUF1573 domain-containing protein [Draconibacterium sp.]
MNSTVNFILESGVSISLLAIIYIFFLRKETFFKLNRIFLLGSVMFSVILPFLKFKVFAPKSVMLAEITVTPYRNLLEVATIYSHDISGNVEQAILSTNLLIFAYLAGVLIFFGRFLFRVIQLTLLVRNNKVQKLDGFKLIVLEKDVSPFSFLDYVFVGRSIKNSEGYDRMITHELEHIKQGHTFDVIILELLTVFQWFNPFMWMLRRAIRENHEFLADQAVLVSGVNPGYYKKLLLNQVVGGQLIIANSFNYSLIKNRIKMMSKIKSSKLAITKITFGILVAAVLVVAFACEQKESVDTKDVTPEQTIVLSIGEKQITITGEDAMATVKELLSNKNLRSINISKDENITYMDILETEDIKNSKNISPETLDGGSEIFYVVEEMPDFPGGELALRKYIANYGKINYNEDSSFIVIINDKDIENVTVKSSCGCTVAKPSRKKDNTIEISIKYDTKRKGEFNKNITISYKKNNKERKTLINITGNVR